MRYVLLAALLLSLASCVGKVDYIRPSIHVVASSNVKIVERPRDAVWSASIPELGKQFFVINNLDKASGLINLSYTGDPERYIDCGRITSYVQNARGERTYDFAGAKAQQTYEIMNPGVALFFIDRRVSLEGRVNLIFEEVGTNTTLVTANIRYVVTRTQVVRSTANNFFPQTVIDTISFNSGSGASFPANSQEPPAECVSTGALEREILSAIK